MLQVLALAPWLALLVLLPVLLRRRPRLRAYGERVPDPPLVSVVVPARNEANNLGVCLASLLDSGYPNYEIIIVDDRSVDGTREIAEALAERSDRVRVVIGERLPDGWIGKAWACWQGYQEARGELLLFTDADTRHEPQALERAVQALRTERADMVSVFPRQRMVGVWERLVLPHVLTMLALRYPDAGRMNRSSSALDVVANGQFILIRRAAYEALGGHAALNGEVVDDLRLAQRVVESGRRLFLVYGEEYVETRMYRSLGGIVEGWSKNVARGAQLSAPAWARPAAPWVVVLLPLLLWVAPPALLITSIFARLPAGWPAVALGGTLLGLVFWLAVYLRDRLHPGYALTYPAGALVSAAIFANSAIRGERVAWKGRSYRIGAEAGVATGGPAD